MPDITHSVLKPYRKSERNPTTAQELVERILGDDGIYTHLETRWEAYKAHEAWEESRFADSKPSEPEPRFTDELTQQERPGNEALWPTTPIASRTERPLIVPVPPPSGVVDESLSELVGLCAQAYNEGVVAEFFKLANENPKYRARMEELPALTGSAETEMEKFYARAALNRLNPPENGSGLSGISEATMHEIREMAEVRLEGYLEKNGIDFQWEEKGQERRIRAVNPEDKATIDQARRMLRLDETIWPFPYTDNYEQIAYGEHHLLTDPHVHQNFPAQLLKAQQEDLLKNKTPEEIADIKEKHPETFGVQNLEGKYMTFVGSGSLPLTGIMNHIVSGCKVNLVDSDPEAVEISNKFITYLESLGVVKPGAIKVYRTNGEEVHYGGPRKGFERADHAGRVHPETHYTLDDQGHWQEGKKDKVYVPTDILYIAGLVPTEGKNTILHNVVEDKSDPVQHVMVRSARGLSRLLYEPVENGPFYKNTFFRMHGTVVPERHMVDYQDAVLSYKEDGMTRPSVSAALSDDNVNTAILLHRRELPIIDSSVPFEEGSKIARHVESLLGHSADYSHIDRARVRRELGEGESRTPS